jgi:hypothetical protein
MGSVHILLSFLLRRKDSEVGGTGKFSLVTSYFLSKQVFGKAMGGTRFYLKEMFESKDQQMLKISSYPEIKIQQLFFRRYKNVAI